MSGGDIRQRRLAVGLRLRELARLARVDVGDLCRSELGKPKGLSAVALVRVRAVLEAKEDRQRRAALATEIGEAILNLEVAS